MRKLKLLLACSALFVGAGIANAQQEPVDGTSYYLYNTETGKFLTRGNNWGTKAVTNDFGQPWQVSVADGKYTLRMLDLVKAGSTKGLGSNGFADNGSPVAFTPSGDANGYTLTNGSNVLISPATYGDDVLAASGNSTWQFLNVTEYQAVLAAKTAAQESAIATTAGVDLGSSTLAAIVNDADNWAAKDVTSSVAAATPSNSTWTRTGVSNRGGTTNNGTYGVERYEGGGTYSYSVTGLTKGIYKVGVKAMFRSASNAACLAVGNEGFINSSAYFDANGYTVQIKDWYSSRAGDANPNSTGEFVTIANNGGYYSEVYTYVGEDGKLDLKAVSESYWGASWFLFNGITLTYYTDAVSDEDATAIITEANAIKDDPMQATFASALTSAISTFESAKTIANYNVLSAAITNARTSMAAYASAKAYLDEAETILANTNVYTAAAYASYFTDPTSKYNERTLTTDEANALVKVSTGWHSPNTIDDILLSTWTIGGAQCKDYDTGLYINTWSIEGNSDGSEFRTPFFEYWTDDAYSLGANTLVSKVTNLTPNATYSFTIRARVRQTNDMTKIANGITMQVGEGSAVDISAGAQFNSGQFYIGNFSAVGQTDAEGNLTTTITVAENSNISWLSFYNCKVTEGEDLSAYIADYEFARENVNAALTNDVAYAAMQSDLQAAADTYASVDETDKAKLIAAKEALETALAAYNAVVAPLKGNNLTGWTTTSNNGSFAVNTWSSEGNTDGSGMTTPFTQNWIARGTSLGDATMSYTVKGLTPGYYKVTALIRSLNEAGGATPAGSFIFANDNIERAYNGTACNNGVYDNPIVYGLVGEDGKLTIGVKIIKANVNWVSWKNFVYEYVGNELTADIANNQTEEAREFANLTTGAAAAQTAAVKALETLSDDNYTAAGQAIEAAYKAIDRDFSGLAEAISAKDNYTLGFETGEYAPYSGIESALATANAIDQNSEATTQSDINAAATALNNITANTEEVNAIYWPAYTSESDKDAGNRYYALGWGKAGNADAYNTRVVIATESSNPGIYNYLDNQEALMTKFGTTYGEEAGYTLPLKANTLYKLSFKYGGMENRPEVTISFTDPSGDAITLAPNFKPTNSHAHNSADVDQFEQYTGYFMTNEAGNYVLNLTKSPTSQQQIAMGNIDLRTATELPFADGSVPTYAPGTYPTVKVSRNLTAGYWATAVYPFKVSGVDEIAVLYDYTENVKGEMTLGFSTVAQSVANEPFLMRSTAGTSEIVLKDVEVEAANATAVEKTFGTSETAKLVGTYATIEDMSGADGNLYVLSNNQLYQLGENAATINPYRAYIVLLTASGEAPRRLKFTVDGQTTAIEGIASDADNMINGQMFDLSGRAVKSAAKGLYIINGKKVLVK